MQDLQAGERDIAFVFQLFALYPHLTCHAGPKDVTKRFALEALVTEATGVF